MILGHDAEFEVVDKNGKVVPAHLHFPPKDKPVYTGYANDPGVHRDQIFRDGTNLEVNTPGEMTCIGLILNATARSLRHAKEMLPAGLKLAAMSAYEMDPEPLKDAPVDVLNSGCSPVRNAYDGWEEKAVFLSPESKERYAGGHIHMSGEEQWVTAPKGGEKHVTMQGLLTDKTTRAQFCEFYVRYLDTYLAVPLLYTGIEGKAGVRRRQVYGKAGEYRFQEYKNTYSVGPTRGIEYRVLGPEWLKDEGVAALTLMMARTIGRRALKKFGEGKKMPGSKLVMEARQAINEGNVDEVFNSPTYQKRLATICAAGVPRFSIEIFKFLRKNWEGLDEGLRLYRSKNELHRNWPEGMERWERKLKKQQTELDTTTD